MVAMPVTLVVDAAHLVSLAVLPLTVAVVTVVVSGLVRR
jgi:hypothetical protein